MPVIELDSISTLSYNDRREKARTSSNTAELSSLCRDSNYKIRLAVAKNPYKSKDITRLAIRQEKDKHVLHYYLKYSRDPEIINLALTRAEELGIPDITYYDSYKFVMENPAFSIDSIRELITQLGTKIKKYPWNVARGLVTRSDVTDDLVLHFMKNETIWLAGIIHLCHNNINNIKNWTPDTILEVYLKLKNIDEELSQKKGRGRPSKSMKTTEHLLKKVLPTVRSIINSLDHDALRPSLLSNKEDIRLLVKSILEKGSN